MDEQPIENEIDLPPLLTWDDLGLPEEATGSAIWQATQYVEPERDGQVWCDWPQAEDMLVNAGLSPMRGLYGIRPSGYRVTRDDGAMTLKLELIG